MNSIIKNNIEGNNPMNSSESFIWTAKFNNAVDICQFDFETGEEKRFQLVKDNFSNLQYFILWNATKVFTVDLGNGLIYFNTELQQEKPSINKQNIRLIFFRRHKIKFTAKDLNNTNESLKYHLGFQWNDNLGNNRQIVLIIDNEGNFVIEVE